MLKVAALNPNTAVEKEESEERYDSVHQADYGGKYGYQDRD